jgi:hypothetical protein
MAFRYRLERYWACAAENTEATDKQKWEFEVDFVKGLLTLHPETKITRDTFEEF